MATYYWLGKHASSGSGNVNTPLNWTTIGPSAAGGQIPPSATAYPGNNDIIIFTQFVGPTGTWPLYSPGGTLGSGISGSTAFISTIDVSPTCPVSIGVYNQPPYANEPFIVNCKSRVSISSNDTIQTSLGDHFIKLNDNKIGAVPAVYDPQVTITLYAEPNDQYGAGKTIRLSGVASHMTVGSDTTPTNGTIYLNDINLNSNSNLPELFYKSLTTKSYSKDTIFLTENAKTKSVAIGGNTRVKVYPGFGTTGSIAISGSPFAAPPSIPTLEFVTNAGGPGSGSENNSYGVPLVTQIHTLEMVGGGVLSPFVNVYHGVGISFLDQKGGVLTFDVPPGITGDIMCSVHAGRFIVHGTNTSELYSKWPTVRLGEGSLGSGGQFIVVNNAESGLGAVPRIRMLGTYDVEINPANESYY
jgi:hypothetical protein